MVRGKKMLWHDQEGAQPFRTPVIALPRLSQHLLWLTATGTDHTAYKTGHFAEEP